MVLTGAIPGEQRTQMTEAIPAGLVTLRELDADDRTLLDLARAAAAHAYSPYSDYPTGTAIRSTAGGLYSGCNMENASFFSICGERNAIAAARVAEGEQLRITDVVVWAPAATAPPCGACRQSIVEFAADARVVFRYQGVFAEAHGRNLLPVSFSLEPPGGGPSPG